MDWCNTRVYFYVQRVSEGLPTPGFKDICLVLKDVLYDYQPYEPRLQKFLRPDQRSLCITPTEKRWFFLRDIHHEEIKSVKFSSPFTTQSHLSLWVQDLIPMRAN